MKHNINCTICSSKKINIFKNKNISNNINCRHLRISDKDYGVTLKLYKCKLCEFIFSHRDETKKVLNLYKKMIDHDYIKSERQRFNQLEYLINSYLKRNTKPKSHLDIGAGSGILTAIMKKKKIKSLGIEPSNFLCNFALKKKRNVKNIELSKLIKLKKKYDFITIIDVLEHSNNPGVMLTKAYKLLNTNGKILIVTPNVSSLCSKLFGFNWWHYRVAHINYFNLKNLNFLMHSKMYTYEYFFWPAWVFNLEYFFERLCKYFSFFKVFYFLIYKTDRLIKLNFFDSIAVIYSK